MVVGGANFDYLARGPALPGPGETVQGERLLEGPGGKGANQAVAAARLGARVALVACVGADARGRALLDHLRDDGVDTAHVRSDPAAGTGVALVQVDRHGQKQIMAVPGANLGLTVADVRAAAGTLEAARVLLVQLEIPLECVAEAIRIARRAGARVVLDPAPPTALPDELLRLVDVIRPNASEARTLTGIRVSDRASARRAAQALLERGVGAAAVSAGARGNLLVWAGRECWLPKIPVEAVDATGAGDAFAAGLAVALAEGRALAEAGPFASATAALKTTRLGAQAGLPRRDEVDAFVRRVGARCR